MVVAGSGDAKNDVNCSAVEGDADVYPGLVGSDSSGAVELSVEHSLRCIAVHHASCYTCLHQSSDD